VEESLPAELSPGLSLTPYAPLPLPKQPSAGLIIIAAAIRCCRRCVSRLELLIRHKFFDNTGHGPVDLAAEPAGAGRSRRLFCDA